MNERDAAFEAWRRKFFESDPRTRDTMYWRDLWNAAWAARGERDAKIAEQYNDGDSFEVVTKLIAKAIQAQEAE